MKLGAYEVVSSVGRGGYGVVYAATASDGTKVAIKVLLGSTPDSIARFDRERRLLGVFTAREGFVPLLDAGTSAEGPYLVMPFVTGGTLRDRLRGGPLTVDETARLGASLAAALAHAHERGIIHRDLKPENVLFDAAGRPLIADLGLAKHFEDPATGGTVSAVLSRSGAFRGTAGYMAPEQMRDARSAGPPADIFSLGAILYECLAGRPAFTGEQIIHVIEQVDSGKFLPLRQTRSDVPGWLETIVKRCLRASAKDRFPDAAALARAFAQRTAPRSSRRPLLLLLVGAVVAAIFAIAGAVALGSRLAPPPPAGPPPAPRAPSPPPRPPAPLPSAASEAETIVRRGIERAKRNEVEAAIADFTRGVELDPTLAVAWLNRGLLLDKKGDHRGSIADMTRYIELQPESHHGFYNRGVSYAALRDYDRAIADFGAAIVRDPGTMMHWYNRAVARGFRNDLPGSLADLTRAIELEPTAMPVWNQRGAVNAQLRRLDDALRDYTKAIELDGSFAQTWCNRGNVRLQLGDTKNAIDDLTRAVEIDPKLAVAWYQRGAARGLAGDTEGAIADYEKAVELTPRGPKADEIRKAIANLKQLRDAK